MASQTVKEIITRIRGLHSQLGWLYESMGDVADKERVKMLLRYVSRHECNLEQALGQYQQQAAKAVLDTWYKVAPGDPLFDLTPETVALRKRVLLKSRSMAAFGTLLLTVLLGLSLLTATALAVRFVRLQTLRFESGKLEEQVTGVIRMNRIMKLFQTSTDHRLSSINLLADVHRLKPPGVVLERIELDGDRGRVTLFGTGGALGDISTFCKNLDSSTLFRDVKQGSTQLDTKGRYAFQANMVLEATP